MKLSKHAIETDDTGDIIWMRKVAKKETYMAGKRLRNGYKFSSKQNLFVYISLLYK